MIKDNVAYRYISDLIDSDNEKTFFLDEKKYGEEYSVTVIHGAYDGNLASFPHCPKELEDLWIRLLTTNDYKNNFTKMKQCGNKIMIRGHDHDANYVYDDVMGVVGNVIDLTTTYRLLKGRRHVINPGALFDGFFATIDTNVAGDDVPILKYHRL